MGPCNDATQQCNPMEKDLKNAFVEFVKNFGTHYMKEAEMGATIYYEKRFTAKSKSTNVAKIRKECVANAARGCTGGSLGIAFFSAKAQTCTGNSQKDCTNKATRSCETKKEQN